MNQSQAVVSAAILEAIWASRKKDMIDLITPFILYAVAKKTSPGGQIDTKVVQEYVQINNAYPNLPESIIKAALSRNPYTAIEKREKKFFLVKPLDEVVYNIDKRERECKDYIAKISEKLSAYLSGHCRVRGRISPETAINKLQAFFSRYGLEVSTDNLAGVQISLEEYETDYYIARFIFQCKDSGDPIYESIIDLVKGYLLRLAIYIQPENGNIQTASFENTSFILDTPVLLSLLGYLGKASKDNVVSLVNMLSQQRAKIYYFPHIKREIIDVLTAYKYSLLPDRTSNSGKTLEGLDFRGFDVNDVEREIQLFPSILESTFGIIEHDEPAYATKEDHTVDETQVLGEDEIKQYIIDHTPHYKEDNLINDLDSVLAVHKLRAGRISKNIESCHYIFVTNNVDFIHAFNQYYRENVESQTFQLVISLNALSAIAWIKCGEVGNLSETELLKNAYCAMQPIPEIMEKIEEVLGKLRDSGTITFEQVVALRASRVFQNDLWVNSFGNVEAINEISVKSAQKKYEESLIQQEREQHGKQLRDKDEQYTLEMAKKQDEWDIKEQGYNQRLNDITESYGNQIRRINDQNKLEKKKQMESIRKKADEYAEHSRKKWVEVRMKCINRALYIISLMCVGGLLFSFSFSDSPLVLVFLGTNFIVSCVAIFDTVFSKKSVIIEHINKKSYDYETKVREEKFQEYKTVLQNQENNEDAVEKQLVGV